MQSRGLGCAANLADRTSLPEDEERAVDIICSHEDKTFSYTDATTFAVAERLEIRRALAFDRHFVQFGLPLVD